MATLWRQVCLLLQSWVDQRRRLKLPSSALVKVNYSFTGWSSALNVLAEVRSRDPIRTTRNAGYTAVASVSLLYLTAVAAFMVVLPKEKIQNSGQLVGALFVKELFGYNAGSKIFPVFVAISCFGGTVASVCHYCYSLELAC